MNLSLLPLTSCDQKVRGSSEEEKTESMLRIRLFESCEFVLVSKLGNVCLLFVKRARAVLM